MELEVRCMWVVGWLVAHKSKNGIGSVVCGLVKMELEVRGPSKDGIGSAVCVCEWFELDRIVAQ